VPAVRKVLPWWPSTSFSVAVILLAAIGCVVWMLVPTFRTFAGPDFEPTPKDEESVLVAQQSAIGGGGAAGTGA
jgi:hypothetical protein